MLLRHDRVVTKPILINIPGRRSIELINYYKQFENDYPDAESETKRFFVDTIEKDWNIVDAGANIGQYATSFSRLSPHGYIFAFEPTSTYEMLVNNLKYAGCKNVEAFKIALSNEDVKKRDKIVRIWGQI